MNESIEEHLNEAERALSIAASKLQGQVGQEVWEQVQALATLAQSHVLVGLARKIQEETAEEQTK